MNKNSERYQARLATLRELAGKHPTWYIAEKMGCSDKSVSTLAANAGISLAFTYKIWTPEQDAVLVQMRRDGHKFAGIALIIGKSEQNCTVRYARLKKRGEV